MRSQTYFVQFVAKNTIVSYNFTSCSAVGEVQNTHFMLSAVQESVGKFETVIFVCEHFRRLRRIDHFSV